MFILAHISDIHLSYPPSFFELSPKRLIGLANWHFNRKKYFSHATANLLINDIFSHNVDHLSITGDLINFTSKREISAATHWLKSLGNPYNISIVPGNHDAYTRKAKAKSLLAWEQYITSDSYPIDSTKKNLFPYLRIRDNIALIGCSTAIATPPFTANGYFGQKQAHDTSNLLRKTNKEGLFRVIMMHHPPILDTSSVYNRMFGIKRFKKMIWHEGAELILHGHTHLNSLHWMENTKKLIPVVGIASASQKINYHKPQASYNLFYIEKKNDNWTLIRDRYTISPDSLSVHKECSETFL
ncbi:metallophosphoesterase [Candidatus Liberibacter africanus]|uniref:Putative phosphoesterase protein n=1 Tax=Candidatus Liberibacter africanus PTSAPSY TaxID=1277257 RepID=A0A0G3I6Y5_LIBAF|nr:metallophosphoesterase [Candidatus Liberibacter africanus]AKK20298.1 putative phosphoesterase protein [Candidatus Liberibacter africanus PTSAPSY]QTP64053.1 metallophosphoesterase [Candidatus Liberibacter africanus]